MANNGNNIANTHNLINNTINIDAELKDQLDMDYLAKKIGLNSRSQVSKTLKKMDDVFIKREDKTKVSVDNLSKNSKSIYEYKIV